MYEVEIMSDFEYESLCSQLENALRRCATGLDGSEADIELLCMKLLQHDAVHDAVRSSNVAAILKYNLIPLQMECANRHPSVNMTASSFQLWYFILPFFCAQVVQRSIGNESFLLPFRDHLLEHDYVSFLLSEYLAAQTRARAGDTYCDWNTATPICFLVEFIVKVKETEVMQGHQQQLSGSINQGASTASRSPQAALLERILLLDNKLEGFLLQHLSLALHELLPIDQSPPGALASLSQRNAGQLQGGRILSVLMIF
jgi:hypothetical protein